MKELNLLIKDSKLSLEYILDQIKEGYDRGETLATTIRKEFEEEDKLYNNQKKNKEKIGDNTFYTVVNSLMAREFVDRPTSEFQAISPGQMNQVKNLNAALDSDFNTREYENLRYQLLEDKYRRGVGIAARTGWDGLRKMPKLESIDPRLAVFDPDGDYINNNYSYFGYRATDYVENLKIKKFFNLEDIKEGGDGLDGPSRIKKTDQGNAGLSENNEGNDNDPFVELYYHFSKFNGVRALVVTANDNKEIVFVKIYPKNDDLKAFEDVLAFRYYRYSRNNPYGYRIAKLGVADLQRVKAKIANLRLDKAVAELYPMYLYNTRLIKNKEDLIFGFNKLVATNPLEGESLNNAVAPIQRDFRADNSYILDNSLDQQVSDITSMNRLAQGSTPERREAATTNKILQDNTDVNLAFNAKIDASGEEGLLRVWLAGYIDKMEEGDEKLIYINTGFGQLPRRMKKKEFISDIAVKIKIETKVEIEERKQIDRVAYAQMIGFLQGLPNRSISAQYNTYRNFGRSWGMTEAQIEMELPPTAQEIIAQEIVGLLLEGQTVHVRPEYDADTHLLAIQAAGYGENVDIYKYELLKLKKIKGETSQMEQNPAVANNLAAQAGAAASNEAISLQNK